MLESTLSIGLIKPSGETNVCPLNKSYRTPHNRIKILVKDATKMVNGPYWCPGCRKERLQILAEPNKKAVYAVCACGLEEQLSYAPVFQPCDYYSKFMDTYRKKQRQQASQTNPLKK